MPLRSRLTIRCAFLSCMARTMVSMSWLVFGHLTGLIRGSEGPPQRDFRFRWEPFGVLRNKVLKNLIYSQGFSYRPGRGWGGCFRKADLSLPGSRTLRVAVPLSYTSKTR